MREQNSDYSRNLEALIIRTLDESDTPLKATEIGLILKTDRDEVNRHLYSTLQGLVTQGQGWRWSLVPHIQNLENRILETVEQSSHPLKAREIGAKLGVPRKVINHYLYSSLRCKVRKNSFFEWTLVQSRTQTRYASQVTTPKVASSSTGCGSTRDPFLYSHAYEAGERRETLKLSEQHKSSQEKVLSQHSSPAAPSSSSRKSSGDPYRLIVQQLENRTPEEKVEILEKAFRQDRFLELSNDEMGALASILDSAKALVEAAKQKDKGLERHQRQRFITAVSLAFAAAMGVLLVLTFVTQPTTNTTWPTPESPSEP